MGDEGKFTYEKFAGNQFVIDVNRRLIQLAELQPPTTVVDLGAGTGAVTRLILDQVACVGAESQVYVVEPSESALEIARRNLDNVSGAFIHFVQSEAEGFSQRVNWPVDSVVFFNAIHLVPEKEIVVQEIQRSLGKGGTFAFNTSFYKGAEPPESMPFYRRGMMKARRYLRDQYRLSPDRSQRAMARQTLTIWEYLELLISNGFRIKTGEVVTVPMPLKGFLDISEYSLFIEGAFPGVPLEAGSESLKHGLGEAFAELGLETSPRNWLQVVAEKV